MSTQSLMNLRAQGYVPGAIWVVVGDCPERLQALPDCINVRQGDRPDRMDWRPVVGLHVDVFDLSDDAMLLLRTMDAIEAAYPKAVGVACDQGVIGLSERHEKAMGAIRRHLKGEFNCS